MRLIRSSSFYFGFVNFRSVDLFNLLTIWKVFIPFSYCYHFFGMKRTDWRSSFSLFIFQQQQQQAQQQVQQQQQANSPGSGNGGKGSPSPGNSSSPGAITASSKSQSEPKPVECNLCHRKFKNIPALNGHMRLHGGYFKKVKPIHFYSDSKSWYFKI